MTHDPTRRASLLNTAFRMALGMSVVMSPTYVHADILRGGGNAGTAPAAASGTPAGGTTPAATNQARTNVQDSLARTTQALVALRAMQDAARQNAINGPNNLGNNPRTGQPLPNVPNGLGSGGLQVDPRVSTDANWWQGAELPTQTTSGDKTNVIIKQTAQQALLNWETFNVGKDTTLNFDQSAGGSNASKWIAFNKVNDPTGNPTQILGSIKAEGQVYIINRNGIIFGGSSQVNVHTLTASALPINDSLVANGLLNNPDRQFLFDGLGQGPIGDVTVQAGAKISSPVSADGNGGRVMLVGANVTNAGTISTPAGQTILAAGLQVGVAAHLSSDPSLRGIDTYVGAVVDPSSSLAPYAGTATNSGIIEAARANVTITGKDVAQLGAIASTTSVSLNGRIDLIANYGATANTNYNSDGTQGDPFLYSAAGSVTLGAGSITTILPEYGSTEKAVGSELALRSQINLQGKTIHLAEGSEILAPNAKVSMKAGRWVGLPQAPYAVFIADGGQVYLDKGATVNLAGTVDASASVLQNYLTLVLRGSELAVAPLQRDGELRGDTITVDITKTGTYDGRDWIGTPLADVSGFVNLIERDVSQLTTAGGSLDISAGGSVVIRNGATVDVSGGWTNFTGGVVGTTQLFSNGQLVDIADATPDRVYSGIFTGTSNVVHSKWGVVEGFKQAIAPSGKRYQEGYTQGAAAGAISISAPSMALDGNLVGTSIAGPNQVRSTSTSSNLPAPASLTLKFQAQLLSGSAILAWHPEKPDVIFRDGVEQEEAAPFATDANGDPLALSDSRRETVYLSPELFAKKGFGNLTVENAEGNILLPEDVTLNRSVGGSLTLKAGNIDIQGDIIAPGGSLSFTAYNISPYDAAVLPPDAAIPAPVAGRGNFTLGSGATLSTAGLITDDRVTGGVPSPLKANGGSISITAYNADLQAGGVLDVSGGYVMTSGGTGKFGNGGSISIKAGQDASVLQVLGGSLNLASTLRGFSSAKGGTLSVQAGHVQIGGTTTNTDTLLLQPEFFNQGGFGTFNISGLGGGGTPAVLVAEGTQVAPVVKGYRMTPNAPGNLSLDVVEDVVGVRQAVSLNLSAPGVDSRPSGSLEVRGDVVLGAGSVLRTDPGGSVSVSGNTVSVLGSIITPGGAINISGVGKTPLVFNDITQARANVYIGPEALLSAAGTTVLLPDAYGRRVGSVLNGGTISVSGNIAAAAGAVLDVSGTSGILDLDPAVASPSRGNKVSVTSGVTKPVDKLVTVPTRINSNGGTIVLKGNEMLFSDATLLAKAGGSTALGGTLSVSSGSFNLLVPSPSDINLTVKQSGSVINGSAGIGAALGNGGHFAIDSFTNGGFDNLTLDGVVSFEGPVDVNARGALRVASGGFLYANSAVNLSASYVALGKALQPPTLPAEATSPFGSTAFSPTYGSGNLTVKADLIDVGSISLQNIGRATLAADNGDIHGSGTFHMAGDLILRAGQIYPVTASNLSFIAYDHGSQSGSITIQASGTRQLPLSAGGTLGIYASKIDQQGTLRAPFGTINLGWDGTGTAPVDIIAGTSKPFPVTSQLTLGAGSVTSVSAVDPITGKGVVIPYGVSTNGENWIDPRGVDITSGGVPEKSIVISGQSVTTEDGSTIDLRGGGDLYAYRFVAGLGGPSDILASESSFVIIPGYQADYAPVSQFNTSGSDANLIGDSGTGYTNGSLQVGDRIYVAGSKTLAEGYYTLLPARYALLPGAVLVSPSGGGSGLGTIEMPDKSSVVSGFRFNSLNGDRTLPTVASRFELASAAVVNKRAEYENYLANTFLKNAAESANSEVPRLPTDSGHLVFQATQAMSLLGEVASNSISSGRGSSIDISTPLDTYITSAGASVPAGAIALDAASLNAFGAESLLIGGRRTTTADGVSVAVRSGSVTVDNAGSPLSAKDLVLVANNKITIAAGAELSSTGTLADSDTLHLSGNGALLRLSADQNAAIVRTGATTTTSPVLGIGAGATLSGKGLILDSTASLSLDPTANLLADAYSLSSGRISLVLDNPGALLPDSGLVLTNSVLDDLGGASSLSLFSYSSIDLYGTGGFGNADLAKLALSAGQIRGLNTAGGTARITAGEVLLQNTANVVTSGTPTLAPGSLEIQAGTIRLGANQLALNGYANTVLNASKGITGEGSGGLSVQGSLTAITPVLTGAAGAKRTISAGGGLNLVAPASSSGSLVSGGLGSTLSITGATVNVGTNVVLPSGSLSIKATTGDLVVNGLLDASGTSQRFHDVAKFTSAGEIHLAADQGNVLLNAGSVVNVSAQAGGGDAGTLGISVPHGSFSISAGSSILAKGGAGGSNGSFELDASSLASISALSASLSAASLTNSQSIRVRNGDVVIDGVVKARDFTLSADQGDITVTGTIDASGATGGSIHLAANGDLTTASGSRLTVAAQDFSSAGKGGEITLEAGTQRDGVVGDGVLDLHAGSILDLSVASKVAGDALTPGSSAYQGEFSGKLHLRAPQIAGDLRVNALDASIVDASSIVVEGYKLYDLTSSGGTITSATQTLIKNDATAFLGANGATTANYTGITQRLLANNQGLASVLVLAPGAEIINRTGNLTLGTSSSTQTSDWDLSTFRFGAKGAAGVLTLRAAGDIVLYNALSDGFTPTLASSDPSWLWTARLSTFNAALPVNAQSWSYRISAGADLAAADFADTLSSDQLGANVGSLKLGKTATNVSSSTGSSGTTLSAITNRFQVIRTGSGDIDINAARNVQLLNQFATIYTAGTRVSDPTMGGTFKLPSLSLTGLPLALGNAQQTYAALYSMAGGNVSIHAGGNIEHLTLSGGNLVADSQFQMPTNWLYRRGYVDPATGEFGLNRHGESASTTWWVDFSNFFQGVGALGGGDVTMIAGNNISNVDAVIPTNGRMPGYTDSTQTRNAKPNSAKLLELGGGDLVVRAGNDIDAGVYYVERGAGILSAGGSIHTNATRSVLTQSNISSGQGTDYTQLPTTLFVGKGGFDISARGDVLLGPVSNPFLLPGGLLNSFWHKSYFSTYAADSYVNVSSLGGDVTLRSSATLPGQVAGEATSLLQAWYTNKLLLSPFSASNNKPWLRLNETSVSPFETMFSLRPGTLETTSFSGDINLVGDLTLSPSASGSLELLAGGSINALQPNGVVTLASGSTTTWGRSIINLSDADPAAIPGIANPFAYQVLAGTGDAAGTTGDATFLDFVNLLFAESGGTIGQNTFLQTKQALHAAGVLHRDDDEPTRLYAGSGDISGLTLFSPKAARIFAGRDISDIALYLQNARAGDASIVASGRDISPYNSGSLLRVASQSAGNAVNTDSGPLAGDIQISGPGSLQVLAGRNIDLGTGANQADGTGTGLTSIGNTRNPYLPFGGADLVVGAGIGASTGLANSELNLPAFITAYVLTPEGAKYLEEISPGVVFADQPEEEQARLAMEVFYRLLRDAGRNHSETGNYDSALAAIKLLFGDEDGTWDGDILTRARDIRTTNGGDISIFTPGGGLELASTTIGNPLSPPGIITESGGNISIFANNDINIGIGRIFTLRGGNEIIWSSKGDIAAGSSSKTVQSAPPTRVLIDPQSAAVETDLSGLATGGGIGVLATVKGVPPGNVDLIAPEGTVDAGDAGIRVSGNLNIAASQVLNTANINVGGTSAGTPAAPSAASVATVTSASNAAAAAGETTQAPDNSANKPDEEPQIAEMDSVISVEVIGYGGGDEEEDEDKPAEGATE